jgi:RNA ligase
MITLDEAREAIKNRPEFFEKDCGDFIVFNYLFSGGVETFPVIGTDPDAIVLRQLRGIKFYKDGKIAVLPMPKFFNINQHPETFEKDIDWTRPHIIMTKMDGSFMNPVYLEKDGMYDFRLATKMGFTETADQAQKVFNKNPEYFEFCNHMAMMACTPTFEYTSPNNRIVLPYFSEKLTLLGVRDNFTGRFLPQNEVEYYASRFSIPLVSTYTADNIQEFIAGVKDLKGIEGFVIRFTDNDQMIKLKTDEYCLIHRAKDDILNEKAVISLICDNSIDDLVGILPPEDAEPLLRFSEQVSGNISSKLFHWTEILRYMKQIGTTRKDFALQPRSEWPSFFRTFAFAFWDKETVTFNEAWDYTMEHIKKNCSTQTKVDATRYIWNNLKWSEFRLKEVTE